MRVLAGQKAYPHYPHLRYPPKVEGKTTENQGFSTVYTSYTQSYPRFLGIRAREDLYVFLAKNAKIHV